MIFHHPSSRNSKTEYAVTQDTISPFTRAITLQVLMADVQNVADSASGGVVGGKGPLDSR